MTIPAWEADFVANQQAGSGRPHQSELPRLGFQLDLSPGVTPHQAGGLPSLSLDDLEASSALVSPAEQGAMSFKWFDGDKFPGGFGPTEVLTEDYWTLRQRSDTLFRTNLYARGLLRRMITNEINTGLTLEAFPDEETLGLEEEALTEWSENIEVRFSLWGNTPHVCDYRERMTFAKLQETVRLESLIAGDILVIIRQNPRTKLPQVQLVDGQRVADPLTARPQGLPQGHQIVDGVEHDSRGRQVAFWILPRDGRMGGEKRVPAISPRTGRRNAWLVYGTEKRLDDVRGQPLLAIILQSLKEIDRYRDSAMRKAVVNSMLAIFIAKGEDKPGSKPLTAGATRRDQFTTNNTGDRATRQYDITSQIPGAALQDLQEGEQPTVHGSGAEVNYGPFEEAMVQAIAWTNEIPPEILKLAFSNNYSASQAAINEYKMYLNRIRTDFGRNFCQPIYVEWLLSEALLNNIRADGLLQAWRDPMRYDEFAAWVDSDWSGAIKPSTDLMKQVNGMQKAVSEGWTTNDRAARELFGQKYNKVIKKLKRENEKKREAMRPLQEAEAEAQAGQEGGASASEADRVDAEQFKERVDAYGVGVRAGVITPQFEDEKYFREQAGVPAATDPVEEQWDNEPIRRPITLAPEGGEQSGGPGSGGGNSGEDSDEDEG